MTRKSSDEALQTFMPAVNFEGYPFDPKGKPVKFTAGVESIPVPSDYIEMLRGKNLVADKSVADTTKPDAEEPVSRQSKA